MIPRQEFGEIPIPLPPLEVQWQIARLAELQVRENVLLQELVSETERLNRMIGLRLLTDLIHE